MYPPPFSQQFFEWEDSGKLHYETWERPGTIATALTFFFFHGICESAEHVTDQYDYHKTMLHELADIQQIKAVDEARRAWLETIK